MYWFDIRSFPIYCPYALRTFLRLYSYNTPSIELYIYGYDERCRVIILTHSIHFFMYRDNIRLEITIYYHDKYVMDITIFVFVYDEDMHLWYNYTEYVDSINNDSTFDNLFIDECCERVYTQLSHVFYKIQVTSTWFLTKQSCTPKTRNYVRKYISRIRNTYRETIERFRKKRSFTIWKEWYFHPDNKDGYIRRFNLNKYNDK